MADYLNRNVGGLFVRARLALGQTQQGLGELLGVSRRTAARYEYGSSVPSIVTVKDLARRVHARGDVALAAELAGAASETIASLGLAPAAQAPDPTLALVVDSVVCAAADAFEAEPQAMRATRAAVHAAFRRARALRLSVEQVDDALTPPPPPPLTPPAPPTTKKKG